MRKAPIALLILAAAGVLLVASSSLRAQTPQPQQTTDVVQRQQPQRRQMNQIEQMLRPLNITPDQEERIQAIYAEMADERQGATRRLRLAHRALSEAIQSPTPDEALIEQRSKEVADAQATVIRLRSLTEARILQVLTQEQRVKLRQLRAQTQRRNQQNRGGLGRGQNALRPNQTTAPLTPRQRRLMRQQQQQRPQ